VSLIRPHSCTFRYRVVEVIGVSETEWGDETVTTAFAGSGQTREFKTHKAAEAYRDKLASESRWPVLIQIGCMQWLSEDEANAWVEDHRGEFWE
jgi:hypothetical protein